MASLEVEVADILGDIRKSKPLLQDFCLLGIRRGAPGDFVEKCTSLEDFYRAELMQGLLGVDDASPSSAGVGAGAGSGDGSSASSLVLVQWAQKMCDLWSKQVGLIRQVIDKAEQKGGIDDSSINQVSSDIPACVPCLCCMLRGGISTAHVSPPLLLLLLLYFCRFATC
jgi:hypothetical protein